MGIRTATIVQGASPGGIYQPIVVTCPMMALSQIPRECSGVNRQSTTGVGVRLRVLLMSQNLQIRIHFWDDEWKVHSALTNVNYNRV
jgi:hypothetical protein